MSKSCVLIAFAVIVGVLIVFWPPGNQVEVLVNNFSFWKLDITPESEVGDYPRDVPILMYHYVRDPDDLPEYDSVGKNLSVSPYTLDQHLKLLKNKGYKFITLSELLNPNLKGKVIALTFDDGYYDFYTDALPLLRKYSAKATVFIITNRIDQYGYMDTSNIQELSQYGVEVGSHTTSHPNLTNTSLANVSLQLEDSKEKLEGIIAKKVTSFCYPAGLYDDDVIDVVLTSGYKVAVTTDDGIANMVTDDMLALPRIRVKEKSDFNKLLN